MKALSGVNVTARPVRTTAATQKLAVSGARNRGNLLEHQGHGIGRLPIDTDDDGSHARTCEAGGQPDINLIQAKECGLGPGEEDRKVLAVNGADYAALTLGVAEACAIKRQNSCSLPKLMGAGTKGF